MQLYCNLLMPTATTTNPNIKADDGSLENSSNSNDTNNNNNNNNNNNKIIKNKKKSKENDAEIKESQDSNKHPNNNPGRVLEEGKQNFSSLRNRK